MTVHNFAPIDQSIYLYNFLQYSYSYSSTRTRTRSAALPTPESRLPYPSVRAVPCTVYGFDFSPAATCQLLHC